jgi:hypothetical protein
MISTNDALIDSHYRDYRSTGNDGDDKNDYLTNLKEISTDIVQMLMDPEFWYQ